MKRCLPILFAFASFSTPTIFAQKHGTSPSLQPQIIKYLVKIKLEGNEYQSGSLLSAGDSTMVLAKTNKWYNPTETHTKTIAVEKVWEIEARKRGQVSKGVGIGIGAGIFLGGLIGNLSYKPCNCLIDLGPGYPTAIGVIAGIPLGALVGGILGRSIKKSIFIKGDQATYLAQREKLKRLSITGQ